MNKQEFSELIFGDNPKKIAPWFELFKDPIWVPQYNQSLSQLRESTFQKLKFVQKHKMVSVLDFQTDPTNIFTAHEFLGQIDPSTGTKFTVQFNLFGGSVLALHTERHQHLFKKIDDLSIVGCFCLTELGYGNNAVEMETTVTYDNEKKEFVVNCPTPLSQKYWITNGACHANYALVFGQTFVQGKKEGVNAFLVPIRDEKGQCLSGVEIKDMGWRMNMNGVDNAALVFHNVRIPRQNMMNRLCDVNEKGEFVSDIKNINARFFKVTERLLSGRLCLASLSIGASRAALYIALKYSMQRKSVGSSGKSDTSLFEYQIQQNSFIPLLARTIALNMNHNVTKEIFANQKGHEHEVLLLCCIDKTLISWNLEKVASVCRERCGGQGFLSCNRFGEYLALSHAAMTAEGDNRVLMTKIVKDLMTNISKKLSTLPKLKYCPKTQLPTFTDIQELDVLFDLLKYREIMLFTKLNSEMKRKLQEEKKSNYQVMFFEVSDLIQELAQAFGERRAFECCLMKLNSLKDKENVSIFSKLIRIYGMDVVFKNLGFFLSEGVISNRTASNSENHFNSLIKDIAKSTNDIIESFNIPTHALYTPIVGDYVKYNSEGPYYGEVVGAKL